MKYYKPHFTNEEIEAHRDYCHLPAGQRQEENTGSLTPDSISSLSDTSMLYPSVAQIITLSELQNTGDFQSFFFSCQLEVSSPEELSDCLISHNRKHKS